MSQDTEKKKTVDRRDILRYMGIGAITVSFGWLFKRAWVNDMCIGHSQCKKCMANTKCELPLAFEFRKNSKMPKNQHKHDHNKEDEKLKNNKQELGQSELSDKPENRKKNNG